MRACMRARLHACVRCMRACVRCMRACMHMCACVSVVACARVRVRSRARASAHWVGGRAAIRCPCSGARRASLSTRTYGVPGATGSSTTAPARSLRHSNVGLRYACAAGYRQELRREFTLFNCFGASFTALSTLTALGGEAAYCKAMRLRDGKDWKLGSYG